MSNIFNTPDTTASYAAADVQNNKVMAVLSYICLLYTSDAADEL